MAGFTPNGLSGDYGGTFLWTRIAGTAVARRLYLMNDKLTAQQALDLGMVHEVLPPDELEPYTREVVALVKDNLNQAEDEPDRRRFLFANEAANQLESGRAMAERFARRSS